MNVSKVLTLILKVVAIITLLLIASISLFTAYIVFAPDNLPKPFRLLYDVSTPEEQAPFSLQNLVPPEPTATPVVFMPGEGLMITTGTKIINLADPSGRRYIRVAVVLEFDPQEPNYKSMPSEEKKEFVAHFNEGVYEKSPIMDDIIITLLSTKTFDNLYTADGKEELRKEMIAALNARLEGYRVISIYFTEFVVE